MKLLLGRSVVETDHIQYALEQSNLVIFRFISGDTLEVYCGVDDENLRHFNAATKLTAAELNIVILKSGSE